MSMGPGLWYRRRRYGRSMGAVFEPTPAIDTWMGIAGPNLRVSGNLKLTSYTPTTPGTRPEKTTSAGIPPMVTVGGLMVVDVRSRAGEPRPGWLATGPRPVQNAVSKLPA